MESAMLQAAESLEFERAAELRDKIIQMKKRYGGKS
jgi:excinuclease UvrABC helicase subunit UvrB